MSDLCLMKAPGGYLVPADEQSRETVAKWKLGQGVNAKVTKVRNLPFFRKFFAMLDVGFEAWEPPLPEVHADGYRGMPITKNRKRFRSDILILAGFYEPVFSMKGEIRLEAKSIAFANMEEDEFERVYSAVADVLLRKVLTTYTRDDLDEVVENLLGFVT